MTQPKVDKITLCSNCNCMTKTIKGLCGKCGAEKPKVDKLASARTSTKGVASAGKANQHEQPKVYNKCTCVYGKDGKIFGLCLRCAKRESVAHSRGYDHALVDLVKHLNGKKPTDRFNDWKKTVEKLLTQTQQETLEWCLEVVKQRKLAKDPVTEIIETIKKKMDNLKIKIMGGE